jgi:hypothetical protein
MQYSMGTASQKDAKPDDSPYSGKHPARCAGEGSPEMPDVPNFTIHDFRRTARTHLAALGVDPVVAERCLNHKIKGVEGIYNRHQYFDERRAALAQWCDLLVALESGEEYNVTPLRKAK